MSITANMVKELREKTGAGMMDCKKALQETDGNEENAIAWLREKGLSKAQKKAGRATSEGLISSHISAKTGALLEIKCETDFVARSDKFLAFAKNASALIAAATPVCATPENVSEQLLSCAKDGELSLQTQLNELVGVLGENIQIGRFAHLDIAPSEGVIGCYIHSTGKIGVMVEIKCESAAAAGSDKFLEFAKNVAMQIAAAAPLCVSPAEVPADLLAKEKEIFLHQAMEEGKPANIAEKIVEGRVKKYYKEVCLLEQPYIRDDKLSIQQLLNELAKTLGEGIQIGRFTRMALGESN